MIAGDAADLQLQPPGPCIGVRVPHPVHAAESTGDPGLGVFPIHAEQSNAVLGRVVRQVALYADFQIVHFVCREGVDVRKGASDGVVYVTHGR